MKKLCAITFLILVSFSAKAQFFTGLAFDVKWQNDGVIMKGGVETKINSAYAGEISPQVGYVFNPNLMVGARINLLFEKSYLTVPDEKTKENVKYISSNIGWDIAPFGRYRIAKFGKNDWFSIWADLHAYYGVLYPKNVREEGYITLEFNRKFIYGIQAMPALGFKLAEKTMLFVNVAILSLAYSGSCTEYEDSTEYDNKVILFTGKLSGMLTALSSDGMYGIKFGIVRTF